MKLVNRTKGTVIAEEVLEAKTFKEKTIGLLGTKKPVAMLFRTRYGIHTFGMQYPIDVLVLSKDNKVVTLTQNLAPNRIFLWNPTYETIVELPNNTITQTRTERGDLLRLT